MTKAIAKKDATLETIRALAREYQQHELAVAKSRKRLNDAIREAAKTTPLSRIGVAAGLSRQRISQVANGASRG